MDRIIPVFRAGALARQTPSLSRPALRRPRALTSRPFVSMISAVARTAQGRAGVTPVKVRFRFRFWSFGTTMFVLGVSGLAISVYTSTVLEPLANFLEEQLKQLPPDVLKRLMEDSKESETYIPVPGTVRLDSPKRYDPKSPEWLAFVKMSHDRALMQRIEQDVRDITRRTLKQAINTAKLGPYIGDSDNLRIDWNPYPAHGQFLQTELVLSSDKHNQGWFRDRQLPFQTARAMYNSLYPFHFVRGLRAYFTVLAKGEYNTLQHYFTGQAPEEAPWNSPTTGVWSPTSQAPSPNQQPTGGSTHHGDKQPPHRQASPANSTVVPPSDVSPAPSLSNRSSSSSSSSSATSPGDPSQRIEQTVGPWIAAFYKRTGEARRAFHAEFSRSVPVRAMKNLHGCVPVSGLFTYTSENGYTAVWVKAWWNPKTEAVVHLILERKRSELWPPKRSRQPPPASSS